VQGLAPEERRALQAVSVAGGAGAEQIARTMPFPDDLVAGLGPLEDEGLVARRGRAVVLTHALIGQIALRMAPHGALVALHAAAADALADVPEAVELRAHHAIRGRADLAAFVLVEDAARLRAARGDDEGAAAVLADAVHAARAQLGRGDGEMAASACAVFGAKLSAALIAVGRVDEAHGLLGEVLAFAGQRDLSRALILEQLAMVAAHRGRDAEAQRRWVEARAIAEHRADRALAERLRRPVPALTHTAPPPGLFLRGTA
jgi:hypothetical protein